MKFYLGTHMAHWLRLLVIPLFVSDRILKKRKTQPTAACDWALDSGGFTELSKFGEWTVTPEEYVERVYWYSEDIGNLDWAAPQDWMCEPHIIKNTGLSVTEHQKRTIENYLTLIDLAPDLPFAPVLQGWQLPDYLNCIRMYEDVGIDLTREPIVGVGSVCRRESTNEIGDIMRVIKAKGISAHGFGVKTRGLEKYGDYLTSADSMAWSFAARYDDSMPGCETHKNCANCPKYALKWREKVLSKL